jgi:hypothetical protein
LNQEKHPSGRFSFFYAYKLSILVVKLEFVLLFHFILAANPPPGAR